MTSLAKQLQKLAIPGQPSLRQVVSKKKPSLLFDAKEAADIDTDTIFSLGVNGLEELISIDKSFAEFEASLFHESCKDFERTVQTKEVLEDLDRKMATFLRRLSPYFLLKPAQKCLEWLIRAFRVNSFNADAIMECILPYYETNLFARVVQLLPLKDPSSTWHWLRPIQKAGSPLSKLTLVQHCVSVQPFLVFVCEMVPHSLKAHKRSPASSPRLVVAFYVSTVLSVLETSSTVNEEVVSRLLPFILKGLKSLNVEYRAASYMITSQLSTVAKLQEQLYWSLIEAISKHFGPELVVEGLACIGVMCVTQQISRLSKKSIKYLLRVDDLVSAVSQLAQSHSISPLVTAVSSSLLENHFSNLSPPAECSSDDASALNVLLSLIDEIQLEESCAYQLVKELLDRFAEVYDSFGVSSGIESSNEHLRNAVGPLAQSLDSKYPTIVDKVLEDVFASLPDTIEDGDEEEQSRPKRRRTRRSQATRTDWLHCFISLALPQSRHQLLEEGRGHPSSMLVLSVHHTNPSMRAAAVKQLGKSLKDTSQEEMDIDEASVQSQREFMTSALLGRMSDDDPSVVLAVLDLKPKVLFSHLLADELISRLCELLSKKKLYKPSNSEWQKCALLAIEILMSQSFLDSPSATKRMCDIIVTSLPLMFLHRHGNTLAGKVAATIHKTSFAKHHQFFGKFHEILENEVWRVGCDEKTGRDPECLAAANELMVEHFGRQLALIPPQQAREIMSKLLLVGMAEPPIDQASFYTSLAVVGYALKYLPTSHTSEPADLHERAIGLQMTAALQLLPHIQKSLSAMMVTISTNEDFIGLQLHESIAAVFVQLSSKHPDRSLSQALLLFWLLKILVEHLSVPPRMSTCMWLELPTGVDASDSSTVCSEPLYYRVVLSLLSLLTHCVENDKEKDDDNSKVLTDAAKILLQTILTRLFTAPGSLLRFLAMIWTVPLGLELELPATMSDSSCQDFGIDCELQACCLSIAGAYLKSLPIPALVALVGAQCPVVPSLLIPLMSPHKFLREGALNCLDIIHQALQSKETKQHLIGSSPFIFLLEKIIESKLELATDPAYLQQLLAGILSAEGASDVTETPSKRKRKRRSTAQDEAAENKVKALECLLMHVGDMGAPAYVQHMLLSALEHVVHKVKLTQILPLMVQLLDKSSATPSSPTKGELMDIDSQPTPRKPFPLSAHEYLLLKLCIGVYVPKMAAQLMDSEDGAFQLLTKLIGAHSFDQFVFDALSPQELAINQVTPAFFNDLGSTDLQQLLLQHLIDALLHTRLVHVSTLIKTKVKKLKLSSELVIKELTRHLDQLGGDIPQTPRKRTRRMSKAHPPAVESTPGGGLPLPWKRVTTVLELIQQTSDVILDVQLLPPHLFNLLNRCLEVEESLRVQLEYTQQLLLSSLLHICSYLTTLGLDTARDLLVESQFNVELVVQCIRLSQNPQTHHHALLLLSTAATIFPNRVLHNIMPIFTFMGAHLLHQDDQYSFQVITKTIDTVIPPLITSGSAIFTEGSTHNRGRSSKFRPGSGAASLRPSSVGGVVKEIIHVFVDALPHVPDHRRIPLFTHLLATVGVEEYLHVSLGLLVEKQVVQASLDQQATKEIEATFPVSLALEFSMKSVLLGMLKLTEYLMQLPQEKPATTSKLRQLPASATLLFNIAAHTDQQLKQFKVSILSLLLSLLSQKVLIQGISIIDAEDSTNFEDIVVRLLQSILRYSTTLNQRQAAAISPQETKFLQSLLKKTYLVVDKVLSLLSVGSFIGIITQLVGGESRDIQRKVIEIFNSRLENGKLKLQRQHDEVLLSLVERLVDVAKPDSTPTSSRHSALHGIQLLTKRLGNRYYSEFFKVAQTVCQLCQEERLPGKVMSSCLLCMSELCRSLGPHTIPLLPSLLPTVLQQLGGAEDKARSDSLQLSAANCLATITETLPKFLSSFIINIITTLCHSNMVPTKDEQPSQLSYKLSQIRLNVSVLVPCRTLLPAYHECYPNLLAQGKDSVVALLGMLSSTIAELKKEDVKNHNALLLQIFTTTLDFRSTQNSKNSSEVDEVESQCVEAFSLLVVKLSEALFRPMFLQLLDWATHPSSPKDRLISFYHLTDCITDKLKNLFLLFAGHIVKSVATLLNSNHINKEGFPFFDSNDESVSVDKSCLLLHYIIQTLTKCFLYDKSGFLTKERFDTLLQPLVDQVSNTLGSSERYRERVESQLAPCLAHFAAAAGKDSLWKPLNHQLLLKSRHTDSQVRYALLKVLQVIYAKLGEEFMVLLPETIPFLAELMEDECEEVEREAQTLVGIIEDIMGESIQQYF